MKKIGKYGYKLSKNSLKNLISTKKPSSPRF